MSFSECPIAPFEGDSTHMALNILNSHLNTFDTLVQWNLGDGNLGYLVLIALTATYTLISTLLFVEPTNLGPTLTVPDLDPTEVVISEIFQNHVENLRFWL